MNNDTKNQLVQCLIDLANTQSMLLVMAGTVKENSQEMLALWLGEYAKLRIAIMDSEDIS
jgi:hypothetical protein